MQQGYLEGGNQLLISGGIDTFITEAEGRVPQEAVNHSHYDLGG
jgi:hypothetical protein